MYTYIVYSIWILVPYRDTFLVFFPNGVIQIRTSLAERRNLRPDLLHDVQICSNVLSRYTIHVHSSNICTISSFYYSFRRWLVRVLFVQYCSKRASLYLTFEKGKTIFYAGRPRNILNSNFPPEYPECSLQVYVSRYTLLFPHYSSYAKINYLCRRPPCPPQHPVREVFLPRGSLAGYVPKRRIPAASRALAIRKLRIIDCRLLWRVALTTSATAR